MRDGSTWQGLLVHHEYITHTEGNPCSPAQARALARPHKHCSSICTYCPAHMVLVLQAMSSIGIGASTLIANALGAGNATLARTTFRAGASVALIVQVCRSYPCHADCHANALAGCALLARAQAPCMAPRCHILFRVRHTVAAHGGPILTACIASCCRSCGLMLPH